MHSLCLNRMKYSVSAATYSLSCNILRCVSDFYHDDLKN